MKLAPFLSGLVGLVLASSVPAFADSLFKDKISVTGTIQQPPLTSGGPGVVYQPTIANILTLLGLTNDPTTLSFYFDNTNPGIVIATKGAKSTDAITPLVVLYRTTGDTFGTDYIGGKVKPGLVNYGENDVLMNAPTSTVSVDLKATSFFRETIGGGTGFDTIAILGHGTIGGTNTIISIKIKDPFKY